MGSLKVSLILIVGLIRSTAFAQSGESPADGAQPPKHRTKLMLDVQVRPNVDLIDKVQPAKLPGSTRQAYLVEYELLKKGQKKASSSVVVEALKKGEVSSKSKGGEKQSVFAATVTPVLGNTVSVDYRLKIIEGKRTFELAKTGVPFVVGSPEKDKFHDSNGDGFDLKVTIIKK